MIKNQNTVDYDRKTFRGIQQFSQSFYSSIPLTKLLSKSKCL